MAEKIVIVGCGPGSRDYLTIAAVRAVEGAEFLVGAERLLDLFPDARAERVPVGKDIQEVLDRMSSHVGAKPTAVLVTGDPGLHSLAGKVIERFGRDSCRVIAGVSSVQVAFARLGLDWSDARIVSAHKEDPDRETFETLKAFDKVAVLGGRKAAMEWIAGLAAELDPDRRIFVCEDLTLDEERVTETDVQTLRTLQASPRTIVLMIRRGVLE